jgi:hypothetical protein
MHLSRVAVNTTIWTFAFVLQCALVFVVFRRGVARRFPVFGSMLVFYPVRAALLFGLSGHIRSGVAGPLYEVLSFADVALQLAVAVELALRLIRGLGGWTRFRAVICFLLLGAASVFTWIVLVLAPSRISTGRLQIFAWFAMLVLFGAVLKDAKSANLRRISAGFASFSVMQLAALAGRTVAVLHRNGGRYVAWSYFPAVGYLAVVIFWIITLQNEAERVKWPVAKRGPDSPVRGTSATAEREPE